MLFLTGHLAGSCQASGLLWGLGWDIHLALVPLKFRQSAALEIEVLILKAQDTVYLNTDVSIGIVKVYLAHLIHLYPLSTCLCLYMQDC